MKVFCSLLMILMLFLVGQPVCGASVSQSATEQCCGSEECAENGVPEHDDDCRGCNPFQNCASCCATGILSPAHAPEIPQPSAIPGLQVKRHAINQSVLSRNSSGIWQPPRA